MNKKILYCIILVLFIFIIYACNNPSQENNSSRTKISLAVDKESKVYNDYIIVHISTSVENAIIKYTIDGSNPSRENGIIYNGSLIIYKSLILKVFAYKEGYLDSDILSITYIINKVAPPKIEPQGGYYENSITD